MVGEIHEAARILDGQHPVLIVVGVRSNPYPYRDIGQPMPKAAKDKLASEMHSGDHQTAPL
jgi:hypothetical protein